MKFSVWWSLHNYMDTSRTALVIPALNEEEALAKLLAELSTELSKYSFAHIIVVDNGSTDRTAEVARNAGALVVNEPVRGYGRACASGFQKAYELGVETVVFMDGDGSDDPADLPLMLAPVQSGTADLVMGSRVTKRAESGAIPPQARFGNWLVSGLLNLMYSQQLHDIGSFRVVQCQSLQALQMREMTFGWPVEMLVKAAQAGYRIVEVPIHYRRRSHGKSKVAGTITGSIKAAYSMLTVTFRYVRLRRSYV
jgi:glycosyltransferase involved in cell wall biosynthesis